MSKATFFPVFVIGLMLVLAALWYLSDIILERRRDSKDERASLVSSLTSVKQKTTLTKISVKSWIFIGVATLIAGYLTRQVVITLGTGATIYFTLLYFGKDPMEQRVDTMTENIAWLQTLTFLMQTSKSTWDSLLTSTKALSEETAKDLLSSLQASNSNVGGYVIRLRDALTLYAIRKEDPQVDVIVSMINANITSSGVTADITVMEQIQEQLRTDLQEYQLAISARRELFTTAKIMFPAIAIMQAAMGAMLGNFILPYYHTAIGYAISLVIQGISIGLIFLFRKFSQSMPETRLIVPETFAATIERHIREMTQVSPEMETL